MPTFFAAGIFEIEKLPAILAIKKLHIIDFPVDVSRNANCTQLCASWHNPITLSLFGERIANAVATRCPKNSMQV